MPCGKVLLVHWNNSERKWQAESAKDCMSDQGMGPCQKQPSPSTFANSILNSKNATVCTRLHLLPTPPERHQSGVVSAYLQNEEMLRRIPCIQRHHSSQGNAHRLEHPSPPCSSRGSFNGNSKNGYSERWSRAMISMPQIRPAVQVVVNWKWIQMLPILRHGHWMFVGHGNPKCLLTAKHSGRLDDSTSFKRSWIILLVAVSWYVFPIFPNLEILNDSSRPWGVLSTMLRVERGWSAFSPSAGHASPTSGSSAPLWQPPWHAPRASPRLRQIGLQIVVTMVEPRSSADHKQG